MPWGCASGLQWSDSAAHPTNSQFHTLAEGGAPSADDGKFDHQPLAQVTELAPGREQPDPPGIKEDVTLLIEGRMTKLASHEIIFT